MAKKSEDGTKTRMVGRNAHWIEWLTGALSAVLVAGMIGWIGYEAATDHEGQPELSTRIVQQDKVDGGIRVTFLIENSGKRTASAVVVQGEVRDGHRVLETSEVTFDYVPAHSSASGALMFRSEPAAGQPDIRPVGYSDP